MKSLVLAAMVLFSFSSFACRIDIDSVNSEVEELVKSNLELDDHEVLSQRLLHAKDFYPDVITNSCPDATLFFHSFTTKMKGETCEVLTKYKLSYDRVEISPFRVLDIDCHP